MLQTISRSRVKLLKIRIDNVLAVLTMLPSQFCELYVEGYAPGERGYRTRCLELLKDVTNTSEAAIEKWWDKDTETFDNCPKHVIEILTREHKLRKIKSSFLEIFDNEL